MNSSLNKIIAIFIINIILIDLYFYSCKNIGISFLNYNSDISNKKTFLFKEDKNIYNLNNKKPINISLSLDNSHIYPSLVVMTSALENNDKDNHILIFYLLLSNKFDDNI